MHGAWLKRAAVIGMLTGAAALISGCNTVGGAFYGAGQDLSALGGAIGGGFTGAYAGAVGGAQVGGGGYGCNYGCGYRVQRYRRSYGGCGGYYYRGC